MTYDEFTNQLTKNRERCERISKSINQRARQLSREAGLHGEVGNILHNAIVSEHYGKPWPGVDYQKAKRAQHLLNHEFDASRIAEEWYTKNYHKVFCSD